MPDKDYEARNLLRAALAGSLDGHPPVPLVPGAEWIFGRLARPLFVDPVVTQLNVSVAAGATTTLTISSANKQWRIPVNDDFGDVTAGVFNVSAVWDDIHSFGPILATNDIVTNGLTNRVVDGMGPIRTKIIYTFKNTSAIAQTLQFTSFGYNIMESLGSKILKTIFTDFDAVGIKLNEAQYSDIVRGG